MKKLLKAISFLFAIVVLLVVGAAAFVATLDADKYRPHLAELMSQKLGRTVKLDGPIAFSLGTKGIRIWAQDASIANPAWASRPQFATVGKLELGVRVVPLLKNQLSIYEWSVANGDVLLETNAAGENNWDLGAATSPLSAIGKPDYAEEDEPKEKEPERRVSLKIDSLSITDSRVAMRTAGGTVNRAEIASATLKMRLGGAELLFNGNVNGIPVAARIDGQIRDLLDKAPFAVEMDTSLDTLRIAAKGKIDVIGREATFASYEIAEGDSKFAGKMNVAWDGPRPALQGTLTSSHLNPADFKIEARASEEPTAAAADAEPSSPAPKMVFSDSPLPFEALKAVDANVNVVVDELIVNDGALKDVKTTMALSGGNLSLSPIKALVGGKPVDLQLIVHTAPSDNVTIGLIGKDVDLGDMQKLGGIPPFFNGQAAVEIQLTGNGTSPRAIASSLGGIINVTAGKGEILRGAAAQVSSALAALFNAGRDESALNCLAVRFIAKNGMLSDNGILIDSSTTTIFGKGSINLASEGLNIGLEAKPKVLLEGLVPSLQVSGSLADPQYQVNAVDLAAGIVGSLMGQPAPSATSSVPVIQAAPEGQNACAYTLDHPVKASSQDALPADSMSKASRKIKDIGNTLLKGLFNR